MIYLSDMSTHAEKILAHMQINPITPLEALRYMGCMRLGARIYDLRRMGYHIKSEIIEVFNQRGEKKRVARYSLEA